MHPNVPNTPPTQARTHARAHTHTHTHTHTQLFNSLWYGTSRVGRYQKKHSSTHNHPDHQTSFPPFTTIHSILFVQLTCLTVLFNNLCSGPLWSSSWSWTLYFILYAFLPNHHILFAAHVHTIAASSAVIPMLCHLYIIPLSAPYFEICLLA